MRILNKVWPRGTGRRGGARPRGVRPAVERLEERCLLSSGLTNLGEMVMANAQTQRGLYEAVVDPTTGFGYFSTSHTGTVIKVNLSGALPVQVIDPSAPTGLGGLYAGVVDTSNVDPAQHYLYFCSTGGNLYKMAPGDAGHGPQVVAQLALSGLVPGGGEVSAAIDTSSADPTQHFAYFGATNNSGSYVLRVRLSDFTAQGVEPVNAPGMLRNATIDPVRHYLYFTSPPGQTPFVLKFNLASFAGDTYSVLNLSSTTPGQGIARPGLPVPSLAPATVVDVANNRIYVGTESFDPSPGQPNLNTWPYNQSLVAQINPGTGDQFPANPVVRTLDLQPGERDLSAVGYDRADGDLIYGTDDTYPAMVIRVHIGDGSRPMQELGSIRLQFGNYTPVPQDGTTPPSSSASGFGESFLLSGFFDAAQSAAYFGTDTYPGQVIKIGVGPTGPPAPSAPAGLGLAPGGDSGASASDGITNVPSPTVAGQAQAGATVALFDGAMLLGTTTAGGSGTWALPVGPLAPGVHNLTATATNSVGTSAPSAPLVVTIDTTPPAAPQFDLDVTSDTAPVGDHATTVASVELTGHTEAGATVTLQQTGATAVADGTGTFHLLHVPLALGANSLSAQAADLAGNTSGFALAVTRLAAPPPTNHKIVFASSRSGNYDIWVMYADGSSPTNLTNNPATDTMPAYTRDGTKIAFVSNRNGNLDLYTMNPDGSGVVQLTSNLGSIMDPVWSNDDSKIAFESLVNGAMQIDVINANGTNLTAVTNFAGTNSMPAFNQDGSRIVFSSTMAAPGGNNQIYSINVNGTGLQRLTNDAASDFYTRCSPDGGHIVFESNRTGVLEIYTMNADGSNQTMLTSDAAGDVVPSYSPDGSQIVFTGLRDGNQEIYTMNADGTGVTRLTNNPARDNYASWDDVPSAAQESPSAAPPSSPASDFPLPEQVPGHGGPAAAGGATILQPRQPAGNAADPPSQAGAGAPARPDAGWELLSPRRHGPSLAEDLEIGSGDGVSVQVLEAVFASLDESTK